MCPGVVSSHAGSGSWQLFYIVSNCFERFMSWHHFSLRQYITLLFAFHFRLNRSRQMATHPEAGSCRKCPLLKGVFPIHCLVCYSSPRGICRVLCIILHTNLHECNQLKSVYQMWKINFAPILHIYLTNTYQYTHTHTYHHLLRNISCSVSS